MVSRTSAEVPGVAFSRIRCRCSHLPTHHMVVVPIGTSASYRLDPTGPCAICGESICKKYQPGG